MACFGWATAKNSAERKRSKRFYVCCSVLVIFQLAVGKAASFDGVSGEFLFNELSAIVGVSAGGKSSLLDVLSGFRYKNVTGSIQINESEISTRLVRKVSSYIMQENNLHGFLTVKETMMFAENFKRRKSCERESTESILESLNMGEKSETFVKNLSGGDQNHH
jgi:ATP-binding cassette, subfamily G (WHITE), member 1